jgi:hypothetical protein
MEQEYDADDRLLMCKGLIKSADIGHPSRPWTTHLEWSKRVTEEFFLQGDRERKLGMDVTPMTDRSKYMGIPKNQVGFIVFLVQPLYTAVQEVLCTPIFLDRVRNNKAVWQKLADVIKEQDEQAKSSANAESEIDLEISRTVDAEIMRHKSVTTIFSDFLKIIEEKKMLYAPETEEDAICQKFTDASLRKQLRPKHPSKPKPAAQSARKHVK